MWDTWFLHIIKNMIIWIKNTEDLQVLNIINERKGCEFWRYLKSNHYGITFVAPSAWTDKKKVLSGFCNQHVHEPPLEIMEARLGYKNFVFINSIDFKLVLGMKWTITQNDGPGKIFMFSLRMYSCMLWIIKIKIVPKTSKKADWVHSNYIRWTK